MQITNISSIRPASIIIIIIVINTAITYDRYAVIVFLRINSLRKV